MSVEVNVSTEDGSLCLKVCESHAAEIKELKWISVWKPVELGLTHNGDHPLSTPPAMVCV